MLPLFSALSGLPCFKLFESYCSTTHYKADMRRLSLESVEKRIAARQQELEKVKAKHREHAIKEIQRITLGAGLTLKDLESATLGVKRRSPAAMAYKDPNSAATWSGRGPAPRWLVAYEIAGGKRSDLLKAAPFKKKVKGTYEPVPRYKDPASGKPGAAGAVCRSGCRTTKPAGARGRNWRSADRDRA